MQNIRLCGQFGGMGLSARASQKSGRSGRQFAGLQRTLRTIAAFRRWSAGTVWDRQSELTSLFRFLEPGDAASPFVWFNEAVRAGVRIPRLAPAAEAGRDALELGLAGKDMAMWKRYGP